MNASPPPLARDMLAEHLLRRFTELEARNRERRLESNDAGRWPAERERLLAAYRRMLGPFPERTPLAPRIMGRLERERYTIEKLIFESQPGLLVTANLYVPVGLRAGERRPAVLVPCGHSETGKAAETYQRVCIGLASKGYVVLIYDPVGQGERQLYWNPETGRSDLGGNTTQHSFVGNQCTLLGINLAQYMVWESIRAIDYLVSRPEVDPERIGMAGNSGGGTNTAQTVPLDERIKAAAICCYVTTLAWRRRAWSTGDAEQNLVGQLVEGLDLPDLVRLVAPRPVLVGSAALDFFPLEGAKEAIAEATPLYEALGVPDGVAHAVAPAPHGYSEVLRRATFAWMNRWLGMPEADDSEPDVPVEPDANLQCAPEGQVALLRSEDVFSVNRARYPARAARPAPSAERVATLAGYESPAARPAARPADTRLFRLEGARRVETFTAWPEPDVAVPGRGYSWRGHGGGRKVVLWLDGAGAEAALTRPAFRIALGRLETDNWLVAAVDVRGVGETAPRGTGRDPGWLMGAEAFLAYEALVAGTPLLGMRVRDAACALDALLAREDVDTAAGVAVVGWREGGLVALHLAALDARVSAVAAVETLESYRSIVEHERYAHAVSGFPPGAAGAHGYDLDTLEGLIAPRRVLRLRPLDHAGDPLSEESDSVVQERLLGFLAAR